MRRGPDEMRINCLVKDSPYLDFVQSCRLLYYVLVLRPGRILLRYPNFTTLENTPEENYAEKIFDNTIPLNPPKISVA